MFLRWPAEPAHCRIAQGVSLQPYETFSARTPRRDSKPLWSSEPRRAMSSAWPRASAVSRASERSAVRPFDVRNSLREVAVSGLEKTGSQDDSDNRSDRHFSMVHTHTYADCRLKAEWPNVCPPVRAEAWITLGYSDEILS